MKFRLIKQGLLSVLLSVLATNIAFTQNVSITVNAAVGKRAVSPYIYGANNWFDKPAQFYKDAGLRMARTNGGNNATKYNWRKRLSSHPDWYNNVYTNDWDKMSKDISASNPNVQVMWAFQLLGRVASSSAYNFNDWAYNQSQWWEGVNQNLAGGGTPKATGSKAAIEGNVNLYTEKWPADSTVGILNHWFGAGGLGLNKKQFLYWNMDNEVDVWDGTHDDVMSNGLLPANEFMDNYIAVAKKARALFPEIKLCGPVATSEWQWFKWSGGGTTINGKYYCWLEYFIKRCADEEKASGIRVLDVVDLHNYSYAPTEADALQNHRMYYDKNYVYPGANGLKTINNGWDTSLTKEYIFQRINDWLDKYYGPNHGITCGVSEWHTATDQKNTNSTSVVYASHLGTFANNGVELFTPWSWYPGMWETLHLFSRYAKSYSVSSTSSVENTVSAYTTVNEVADSMTVIIVNRDVSASRNVTVNLSGFSANNGNYSTLQLASLPTTETFKSHTVNALKKNSVAVTSNSFTITVPALSTTAVLLKAATTEISYANNQIVSTIHTTNISSLPMVVGNVDSYSITPALPSGVTLNTTTGEISGVPTVLSSATTYTITATYAEGSTTTTFKLTVNDIAPTALLYANNTVVATINKTNVSANPTVTGTVVSYSISPALPAGVSLNTTSGVISGVPTVLSGAVNYTVTATNTGGSTTAAFALTVNEVAPTGLSYAGSPVVATITKAIVPSLPTVTGNVISFSVSPALPTGVTLNTTTGEISGVPTVLSSATIYTVTATNSGGSTTAEFMLTINDIPSSRISDILNQPVGITIYPNPATDILNVSILSSVAEQTEVTITDLFGRKIQTSVVSFDGYSPIILNTSTLSRGFYLLSVRNSRCRSTKSFSVIE